MSAEFEHLSSVIDKQALRRDLYFVVRLLLSDQKVSQSGGLDWTDQFHENEIMRLLLWMAVAVRGLLDYLPRDNEFSSANCGEYWPAYENSEQSGELGFRQACNSIIHATEFVPYNLSEGLGSTESDNDELYVDRITIRSVGPGSNAQRTRSQLDVVAFARVANKLIERIEGDADAIA